MRALLTDPRLGGWPSKRVEFWLNRTGASQVTKRLRQVANATTDVLLLYFVGHGTLTERGELCLALTDTEDDHCDLTGLEYERVRDALEASPARIKVVILDCCYSGRVIEALAPAHIANITEIRGAYTLTASDETAHVVALPHQRRTHTSFTGELIDLVHTGIPNGQEWLTLRDVFPDLRHRLMRRDLPLPNNRGTGTADGFPFVLNSAYPAAAAGGTTLSPPENPVSSRPRPRRLAPMSRRLISRRNLLLAGGALLTVPSVSWAVWRLTSSSHPTASPAGLALGEPLTGHRNGVWVVAAGVLGNRPVALSAGEDARILVWDLTTHEQAGKPLTGHSAGIWALAMGDLNGEPVIVSGGEDHTVRLWSLAERRQIGSSMTGHEAPVKDVALHTVGGQPVAVTAGLDNSARVWDLTTRKELGPAMRHPGKVLAVACGKRDGGPIAVTGGDDKTIRVWGLDDHAQLGPPLTSAGPVEAIALGDLDTVPIALSGGPDKAVRVWDLKAGQPIGAALTGHTDWIWGAAIGRLHGQTIAVTVGDGIGRVWNLTEGGRLETTLADQHNSVWGVALTSFNNHTLAVTGCLDARVRMWDLGPS
ncbi:caspase family protein [Sphaerisporangium aureirubrum]